MTGRSTPQEIEGPDPVTGDPARDTATREEAGREGAAEAQDPIGAVAHGSPPAAAKALQP